MSLFEYIMEYSRAKEDRINDEILLADTEQSSPISRMINSAIKHKRNIWVMTDWHLVKYNKDTGASYVRPETKHIMQNILETIKPNDILIYLGDICDGEIEDKKQIESYLNQIPGIKILVRGNNDLFSDKWYLDHGFQYVTPKFTWNHILFTHRPQDNKYDMNIHGHIHGSCKYYNSEISHFDNQIDVAWLDGRVKPIRLQDILKKQKAYAKEVTFINKPWKDDTPIVELKK